MLYSLPSWPMAHRHCLHQSLATTDEMDRRYAVCSICKETAWLGQLCHSAPLSHCQKHECPRYLAKIIIHTVGLARWTWQVVDVSAWMQQFPCVVLWVLVYLAECLCTISGLVKLCHGKLPYLYAYMPCL